MEIDERKLGNEDDDLKALKDEIEALEESDSYATEETHYDDDRGMSKIRLLESDIISYPHKCE